MEINKMLRNGFSIEAPSAQTAIDIFKDSWWTSMPRGSGLVAGSNPGFEDTRCDWVNARLPLSGQNIIELGPFEAYNTWQLCQLTGTRLNCVEANKFNYLKCLVVKEVLGLNAQFMHGDMCAFLSRAKPVDVIWASGVLYHQTDPLEMLRLCSMKCKSIYLWTHYYDDLCAGGPGFCVANNVVKNLEGFDFDYHFRSYDLVDFEADIPPNWSAGTAPHANWLKRADILRALELLGYTEIQLEVDGARMHNLPVISLLARRPF